MNRYRKTCRIGTPIAWHESTCFMMGRVLWILQALRNRFSKQSLDARSFYEVRTLLQSAALWHGHFTSVYLSQGQTIVSPPGKVPLCFSDSQNWQYYGLTPRSQNPQAATFAVFLLPWAKQSTDQNSGAAGQVFRIFE